MNNWQRRLGGTCVVVIALSIAYRSASAVAIETVPVGNVGNANDPRTGNLYGGVSYAYNIGKYEVTVGQYTEFLNAVADTDTYSLYNTLMATDLNIAGISRGGLSGSYTYGVIGSANKAVTYVSWGDTARFANWLHNGQPTGPQNATTTERGAYTLDGATTNAALSFISRNTDARWFIPTEDEWYKAAYHQPVGQGGDVDNYWFYPTRTNSEPFSDQPPGTDAPIQSNTANFYKDVAAHINYDDGWAVTGTTTYDPSQHYGTDVGAYTESMSPYGTFDQAGNAWEWNEAVVGPRHGLRGGSADWPSYSLASAYRNASNFFGFEGEFVSVGFRVASIPEPSTLTIVSFACLSLMWLRRIRSTA